jgi:phospholipase C
MRENRSFDHYFGRFPGADGLPPGAPARPATAYCLPDPPHTESALRAIDGSGEFADPAALAYFTEDQVPLAWALARRFTLCDRYFASVLGPTFVNRLFSIAASPGGFHENPKAPDPALLPRPNLVDRLEQAHLDWACYCLRPDSGYSPVSFYPERLADPRANRTFDDFLADCSAGRLPAVSWVVPQDPLTEHPPSPPQWGQRFAALTAHAVAAGPQWRSSALVLNYDESGGFYDHVPPPRVDADGYGYRVPCTVVSPFARARHVSHADYDHASVLALVERTFGLKPLAARDAAADPMEDCFDFAYPDLEPVQLAVRQPRPGCGGHPPDWAAAVLNRPMPQAAVAIATRDVPSAGEIAGVGGLAVAALGAAALGMRWRGRRAGPAGRAELHWPWRRGR